MNTRFLVALLTAVLLCGSASVYAAATGTTTGLVDIDIKDVPVKQAIDTIFADRGMRYIIEPGVTGRVVELKLKGITVAEALRSLGDAAGFSYTIEDGIYIIGPKTAVAQQPAAQMAPASNAASLPAQTPAPVPTRAYAPVAAQAPPPVQWVPPPAPAAAPPVIVNAYIPGGQGDGPYAYGPPPPMNGGYSGYGFYSPFFTIGPPPYVIGQWPNPPPPPGWLDTDAERLLRFQWAITRRPSFITPY